MDYLAQRKEMVKSQLENKGIHDPHVLAAFLKIPRHLFVPEDQKNLAYYDGPLPIGEHQTISQPYVVAYMTQALNLLPSDKILEIGTGSGYQAAILSLLVSEVYSVEIIASLGPRATAVLKELGLKNVHTRISDGSFGWPEEAPFDGIIVTAAPEKLPIKLVEQLKIGGKIIIPVALGPLNQSLRIYTKMIQEEAPGYRLEITELLPVLFVPMTGEIKD
ncbi:MAG: protein-L-isoaspartate O-methyltransferase [Epsilonproteobacteria bacterium]|nr:MAG: protein-L-isoaspartate O-methyltransferase [Campylobacterota bacterium]RLA66206.1 MAG: protein-L-isoaspartate O-methyltransferase [Campylobacterota bacterium]